MNNLIPFLLILLALSTPGEAADPLVRIETDTLSLTGRIFAHNDQQCWLLTPAGRMETFRLADMTAFEPTQEHFRPCSPVELRTRLRREFGPQFEIAATTHYLVVAAKGHADRYADFFEQLYREFYSYFSVRGFEIEKPEFPLVAIVFPDSDQFANYAGNDGIRNVTGLAGYYELKTNRIALFDPATSVAELQAPASTCEASVIAKAGVATSLKETIVHEATHQVAFNLGLHSRIGQTPRWVVEGLAMVFEHPDSRTPSKLGSARRRVNRERFLWFGNYRQRRAENSLEQFLSEDHNFTRSTLDAYSEAWALTFFLIETRSAQYARFLHKIAARDPTEPYTPEQRLEDFRSCFGSNLGKLEVEFLRFHQEL